MLDVLLSTIAVGRLAEGAFALWYSWQQKRWVVALWGALVIVLSVPVAAIALGWNVSAGPAAAISGLHLLTGACVIYALVSSTIKVRELRLLLLEHGISPGRERWRA
jgi:hypothetical protein